jgi:hypothetical protein
MFGRPHEKPAARLALLAVLGCDRRDKPVDRALPPAPAVQAVAPAAIEDAGPAEVGANAQAVAGSSWPLPVEIITSLGYVARDGPDRQGVARTGGGGLGALRCGRPGIGAGTFRAS